MGLSFEHTFYPKFSHLPRLTLYISQLLHRTFGAIYITMRPPQFRLRNRGFTIGGPYPPRFLPYPLTNCVRSTQIRPPCKVTPFIFNIHPSPLSCQDYHVREKMRSTDLIHRMQGTAATICPCLSYHLIYCSEGSPSPSPERTVPDFSTRADGHPLTPSVIQSKSPTVLRIMILPVNGSSCFMSNRQSLPSAFPDVSSSSTTPEKNSSNVRTQKKGG